jgi:hypothetical protein
MPKIKLNEAWMFAGVTYLAGDHTVDDDLARIFEARGAFAPQPAAGEPAELAPNTPPGAPQAPAAPQARRLVETSWSRWSAQRLRPLCAARAMARLKPGARR